MQIVLTAPRVFREYSRLGFQTPRFTFFGFRSPFVSRSCPIRLVIEDQPGCIQYDGESDQDQPGEYAEDPLQARFA